MIFFFFFLVLSAWWMASVQRAETTNILCGGPNGYRLRSTLLLMPNLLRGRDQPPGKGTTLSKNGDRWHCRIFEVSDLFLLKMKIS